jgi:hypothetical protein
LDVNLKRNSSFTFGDHFGGKSTLLRYCFASRPTHAYDSAAKLRSVHYSRGPRSATANRKSAQSQKFSLSRVILFRTRNRPFQNPCNNRARNSEKNSSTCCLLNPLRSMPRCPQDSESSQSSDSLSPCRPIYSRSEREPLFELKRPALPLENGGNGEESR